MSRDKWDIGATEEVGLLKFAGWQFDPAGYRLTKVKPSKLWSEKLWPGGAVVIEGKSGRLIDYPLGPQAPVHREFTETTDDADDIIKFVNAYGLPNGGSSARLDQLVAAKARLAKVEALVDRANKMRGSDPVASALAVEQMWEQGGRPKLQMQLSLLPHNDAGGSAVLRAAPDTLLDYMHLQFAEELQGRVAWRRCSVCGKWMPIGAGRARSDKATCSERCRKRKQRQADSTPKPSARRRKTPTKR